MLTRRGFIGMLAAAMPSLAFVRRLEWPIADPVLADPALTVATSRITFHGAPILLDEYFKSTPFLAYLRDGKAHPIGPGLITNDQFKWPKDRPEVVCDECGELVPFCECGAYNLSPR